MTCAEPISTGVIAGQRVRWYPSRGQRNLARQCFDQARMVYNQGLHQLEVAYRASEKCSINEISARWTKFKATDPAQQQVPSAVAGQALRHLDAAFKHFFRRVKLRQKPGYPKPKGRYSPDQCTLAIDPRHKDKAAAWGEGRLLLPGFGLCRVRGLRAVGSLPKTIGLSRDALGRYWLSFNHERVPKAIGVPEHGWHSEVGIDLGITTFATLSNGEKIDNPRHLQGRLRALKRSQRALSRCQAGSRRRRRRVLQVARLHAKVAQARENFLHQTATQLMNRFGVIAVEDLNVKGMSANRHLARHVMDLGLGRFVSMLEYKASWSGRVFQQCGRWDPTSQVCSACGYRSGYLPLNIRRWTCAQCSADHDRDVNAAINVLAFARRNRVQDVEGDTPAAASRRPVKRQLPLDHPEARTMCANG